jgi:23S rRNA pseudouridine2605 synthase
MALERVQKIISNAGFCSRRKAEEFIAEGKVTVNGKTIKLGDKADVAKDEIIAVGRRITAEQKKYYAFYKPHNVLTTLSDPSGKPTVADYVSHLPVRVFPTGRLDYDAEGLLILTNDGDFANRIMHPRYEVSKKYEAELRERIRDAELAKIKGVIRLEDGPVKIESCKRLNEVTIELTIHEGRHKIVKRIFKELGFYVKRLKRIQVGPFKLGRLKAGEVADLPKETVKEFLEGRNRPEKTKPSQSAEHNKK